MLIRDLNGFYLKTEKDDNQEQITIFDGIGIGLGKNRDNLTYNPRIKGVKDIKRLENIICNTELNIAECIIWLDFTNPGKKLKTVHNKKELNFYGKEIGAYSYNLGENDNAIIFNAPNLVKELNVKSLALAGAVADCAGICGSYEKGEIISLTHAGWQGIVNGVIEQIIHTYIANLGNKEFKKVKFDISPMAGENYEWDKKFFDVKYLKEAIKFLENEIEKLEKLDGEELLNYFNIILNYFNISDLELANKVKEKHINNITKEKNMIKIFLNLYETYNIDPIKEKIVEKTTDPQKVIFFLDRIIKRIFLENGVNLNQLNFHQDYTTDIRNPWPSYRIHSLWKKGIIEASWTEKEKNGIIYDKRIGIFNIISIK